MHLNREAHWTASPLILSTFPSAYALNPSEALAPHVQSRLELRFHLL